MGQKSETTYVFVSENVGDRESLIIEHIFRDGKYDGCITNTREEMKKRDSTMPLLQQ